MLTEQQIDEQIQREDIDKFNESVFDGFLPVAFVAQFKIAVMFIPPTAHKIPIQIIEKAVYRKKNEHTFQEVGMMINLIFSVPWASMYKDIDEALEKNALYDRTKDEYNKKIADFQKRIDKKKASLMKMAGIGSSVGINSRLITT